MYLWTGWFLFNPAVHLFVCLLVILHRAINNNRCILTDYTNEFCGLDKNTPFKDPFIIFGFDQKYLIVLIGAFIVYDFYWILDKE